MKQYILVVLALLVIGCGIESDHTSHIGHTGGKGYGIVAEAPNNETCTEENIGALVYADGDSGFYACDGVEWKEIDKSVLLGDSGADGKSGAVGRTGASVGGVNWLGALDSEPSNSNEADTYFNTTDGKIYRYDGSDWVEVTTLIALDTEAPTIGDGSSGDKDLACDYSTDFDRHQSYKITIENAATDNVDDQVIYELWLGNDSESFLPSSIEEIREDGSIMGYSSKGIFYYEDAEYPSKKYSPELIGESSQMYTWAAVLVYDRSYNVSAYNVLETNQTNCEQGRIVEK